MQSAAKVGALVVVFTVLLIGAFTVLGRSLFARNTTLYHVLFEDAAGMRLGTPVLLAGVKVGEVTEVGLASPTQAKVSFAALRKIPAGSTATIPSSLVGIGESQIVIVPPEKGPYTDLAPGSTLLGKRASPLDSILPDGKETVKELTATIKAVRLLLEDERLRGRVDSLMATTETTLRDFGRLAARMDATLAQNQGNLQDSLIKVSRSLSDVNRITAQVAKMAEDPRLRNDALGILAQVRETTGKVNVLVGDVGKLAANPALTRTVENVEAMTQSGKRITENTERITASGAVISEKAIGVTDQVGDIAGKASDIAADVKALTQRVSGILNPKPKPGALAGLQVGMDLFRETNPSYWRTDVEGTLPFQNNRVHFGLHDAFESNRFTFQLGTTVSDKLAYRYGIYAGRAGAGVDYQVAPRLFLRGDLWNLNDPRLDIRTRYDFGNGLYGWLGFDRLFRDNAPTVGIGIRR